MKKGLRQFAALLIVFLAGSTFTLAQEPQPPGLLVGASTIDFLGNGTGYLPMTDTGLQIRLTAGLTYCGNPKRITSFPGGTVPVSDNATNYVFLDPANDCAPSSSTKGIARGQVALARVEASGGTVTSVADARAWAEPPQLGTDAMGRPATRYLNGVRWADQFGGSNGTEKLDAAIADADTNPGLVIAVPGTGHGNPSRLPNNVALLDFRQATDIVGRSTTDPDRPPVMLLQQTLGEFSTRPLQGTITFTNGSTEIRGVGTAFMSQLGGGHLGLGRSIKLDKDSTESWAEVASVSDDTHATLKVGYPGSGGSGKGSYFVTEHGFAVHNVVTGGTPNTLLGGESVGLTVVSHRLGGARGLYGANFNVNYRTAPSRNQGQAMGLEIDLNNDVGTDDTVASQTYGLAVLSSGTNHPNTAIQVASAMARTNWLRGAFIGGWSQVGMYLQGSQDHLRFFTGAPPNGNPQVGGRNPADTTYLWNINNDGSAVFSAVTLHPTTVGQLPPPSGGNTGAMARVSDSTPVTSEGQTCQGGSNHTALAFSDGTRWKCF